MNKVRRTARSRDLLIEPMDDEVVVYDQSNDTVHHLNRTTAAVWRRCTGGDGVDAIVRGASEELGIALPAEAVEEAISLLDGAGLLEPDGTEVAIPKGMSRRDLLIRMGLVAAAIPVITTIVAPTPAAAATCVGQACKLVSATPIPCPGETTAGTGNCRCSSSSGNGTCGACQPGGTNVGAGNGRLCCSLVEVSGTCQ